MIRLEGISKSYGKVKVLESVDLEVVEGKSLCVLGRSGCGKSTLLKLIALIVRPDQGSLLIDGSDVANMTETEMDKVRMQKIAFTFQEPLLIPYITALQNLALVAGVPKERAAQVLTRLGLGDRLDHRPPKLSGGEKKRVDLARAIVKDSPFLIADEPFSNLDPETGSEMVELLKEHVEKGRVLIYSSVEPSETKFASQLLSLETSGSDRKIAQKTNGTEV